MGREKELRSFKREFLRGLGSRLGSSKNLDKNDLRLDLHKSCFNDRLQFVKTRGNKSLVFTDGIDNVIKAYVSPGAYRKLPDIAKSYENSHLENPDFFPEAHKVGNGEVIVNNIPHQILFIWQRRVDYPRISLKGFDEGGWNSILKKWDQLIERNRVAFPKKLEEIYNQILAGDMEAFRRVTDLYYDSFSSLQAGFAIGSLKLKEGFEFLQDFSPPEPSLLESSKIIGDLAPKHLFSKGSCLAFDLEKYGLGDPAVDLSTAVRFYLKKDPRTAGRFFEYLSKRYENPKFMKNIYLGLIGDKARVLLYPHLDTHPQHSLEPLKRAVGFFPAIKKYL